VSTVVAPTPVERMTRDLRKAASTLGPDQARFLVDTYYESQDFRIATRNQVRSLSETGEPHDTLAFFARQFDTIEDEIRKALDTYSINQPLGEWVRQIHGIGPVTAAGLLAHVDVEKAPHASSLWRYAGLAQDALDERAKKGEKRTWNESFKVLCWRIGDSFVKQQSSDACYYGKLYLERKVREVEMNEAGAFSKAAERWLKEINFTKKEVIDRYKEGKLPDSQVDKRARRYAIKRFLATYWRAAWIMHYNTEPPHPYVQEYLGHTHIVDDPNVPLPTIKM
jgi:transposase IS116/IS110/IS902 family protein